MERGLIFAKNFKASSEYAFLMNYYQERNRRNISRLWTRNFSP